MEELGSSRFLLVLNKCRRNRKLSMVPKIFKEIIMNIDDWDEQDFLDAVEAEEEL